ncbi:hypothetical protein [Undibacterium sp. RuRC25W]|uniref:hypothetical protein n=1 Tax=Undibacterium sp. RuRC25W TaxID=3413047 RepID=UPI003BF14A70
MQVISTKSELQQINGAAQSRFNQALQAGLTAAADSATHPFTYIAVGAIAAVGYSFSRYFSQPSRRR